jgi:hypothetical protein
MSDVVPATPAGPPVVSGTARYAGGFWVMDPGTGDNEVDYVAAFKADGTQLWASAATVAGGGAGSVYAVSASNSDLFVAMYPMGPGGEAIYAYPNWKSAAANHSPSLVLSDSMLDSDGNSINFALDTMRTSADGKTMLLGDSAGRLLAVDLATHRITVLDLPGSYAGAVFGLDGHIYGLNSWGELYRVGGASPQLLWSNSDYSGYSGNNLQSVDAAGNAYVSDRSNGYFHRVAPNGDISDLSIPAPSSSYGVSAFDPSGKVLSLAGDPYTVLNALWNASDATLVADPLFTEPGAARSLVECQGFVGVQGSSNYTGTIIRTGDGGGSGGADTTPPSKVAGLDAVSGINRIDFSWSPASDNVGVTGYRISVVTDGWGNGGVIDDTISGTSYALSSSFYEFRQYTVAARDAAGNWGTASDPISAIANKPPLPPVALTGIVCRIPANPLPGNQVSPELKWDAPPVDSPYVNSYNIYYRYTDVPSTSWTLYETVPGNTAGSENGLFALSKTRQMDFYVTAVGDNGESPATPLLHVYRGSATPSVWVVTTELNGWTIVDQR